MAEYNQESETAPGFIWIVIGFLVFLLDFVTSFKGIDFESFKQIILIGDWRIYINALTILLVVLYYLFINKEERDPKDILSFAALVMLLSIIISMGGMGYLGATIHLVFAFTFLFSGMYKIMEKKQANMIILVAIFLDFFAFSLFGLNKLIFPIWFLVPLFFTKPSKPRSWLIFIVILLYVFHSFGSLAMYGGTAQMLNGKDLSDFVDFFSTAKQNFKEFGVGLWQSAERQKNITQAMVFGDYYTSQVDQNVQQPLGLRIIEVKSTDTEIYEDEPVTAYARVQVRTIKDEIILRSFCKAGSVLPDAVNPAMKNISEYEDLNIDCIFNKCRLPQGSNTIYFTMAFNFETLSYLRNYFIDRERMMVMIREDPSIVTSEDILRNLGISDTSPIALSTSGPAKIGMELEKTQPIGIDRSLKSASFRLGITLENIWEGEIKDVKSLTIILPKEMDLEKDSFSDTSYCGGYVFEETNCADIFGEEGEEKEWCSDAESNIYSINQAGKNQKIIPAGQQGIKHYKSLVCRVGLTQSQYNNFLGNAPISTKNFKVISEYDYELKRSLTVNIKKSPYDGCKEIKTEEAITQQDCKAYTSDKTNLPSQSHQERYSLYQNSVTSAIKTSRPSALNIVEAEALIAAVMSAASNMGEVDENKNDIPDYIAGYGIKFPGIFLDNYISNIQEAAKFIKATMDKETGTKEEKVAKTLTKYASNNGLDTDFAAGVAPYFIRWQNMLCKGDETAETGTGVAEEDESTGIFKKDILIGIDTNDDLAWTGDDQYFFIEGYGQGVQGQVYLLSDSKEPLRDQMIVTTFDNYIMSYLSKHKVGMSLFPSEPTNWNEVSFSPSLEPFNPLEN